MSSDPCN